MKMTTVSYRETVTFGNYQNATVEMGATVDEHDSAEDVLRSLKNAVQRRLQERTDEYWVTAESENEIFRAKRELENLNAQIEEAARKFEAVKAFLARHGVDLKEEIPF